MSHQYIECTDTTEADDIVDTINAQYTHPAGDCETAWEYAGTKIFAIVPSGCEVHLNAGYQARLISATAKVAAHPALDP